MFQDEFDNADKLRAHLDMRARWDQHKQEPIASLFKIAYKCLEMHRKKRPKIKEPIPDLEKVRRGREALQALEEAAEKECCICFNTEEVDKLLALVPCGHRCVCAACSPHFVGKLCTLCKTEATLAISVFD
jgi:hypothetical protein